MKSQFSRMDLIVAVAVVATLIAWFGFSHAGERGRIAQCAENLKALGTAMHAYANDHVDGLPAAGISLEEIKISWDEELFPYLDSGHAKSSGSAAKGQLLLAAAPRLVCPSDTLPRGGHPRTYAMAGRDMALNWPPASGDNTGVGVWWDRRSILELLNDDAWIAAQKRPDLLPKLKQSVLPAPAGTLLLSEFVVAENKVGNVARTRVVLTDQQTMMHDTSLQFHFGKINYLMASSSRFGHFAITVGCGITRDGWQRDFGGWAGEGLGTRRKVLEPAGGG